MADVSSPGLSQNYVTTAEAAKWIGDTVDNSNEFALDLIVGMACDWVQKFLNRAFVPTTYTRRFDGVTAWNGTVIELPASPVLQVASVIEYWGTSGPHVLLESTPTNQVDGWQCEYETGRLIRVFQGNLPKPWFPGSRNIEVKWVAGYNPIPHTIKVATLELIKHWFINTQQNTGLSDAPGVGYDMESPETSGLWAGLPHRIKGLLEPWIQVGIG